MSTERADLAVSATGLLRQFHEYGVLTWADVHPAQHICHLYKEKDERVALAAALAVRALRSGSMCVDLAQLPHTDGFGDEEDSIVVPPEAWPPVEDWLGAVAASPAVGSGPDDGESRPLRLVDGLLYLERYWQDQERVRTQMLQRLAAPRTSPLTAPPLAAGDPPPAGQDQALASALASRLTVIAGGPGTGKTRVIARIVDAFAAAPTPVLVGLAAPTGKAAARMTDSLLAEGVTGHRASTLHRLLGWKPGSRSRFKHDQRNPLPHDVVIIDELSMVSMTLMARLLDAVRPDARLVLVGDPDQLASVEAGAVLADLVAAPILHPAVVLLTQNFRFTGAIRDLADAIRLGDAERALGVLGSADGSVRLVGNESAESVLRQRCVRAGARVFEAALADDGPRALAALDEHRLLCGHRNGPFGVQHWSRVVTGWLAEDVRGFDADHEFYVGRPLLVTRNVPDLELYNGDTGVVLAGGAHPEAVFGTGLGPRRYSPYVLDGLASVHAMTIHKSQGSQFEHVSVILPPVGSPLLTRELLYTAVTRASRGVVLVGTEDAVRAAILRPSGRTSGLASRLAQTRSEGGSTGEAPPAATAR